MLGADVDAARRIEAKQGLEAGGEPSRDHHLLLVAAAQAAQFRLGAGVDLQPLDACCDALALGAHVDQAPIGAGCGRAARATFSRIERCGSSACSRFAGNQHQACARSRRRDG